MLTQNPEFSDRVYIQERTDILQLLDLLSEEAAELSMAASKYARVIRGTDPTPVKERTALANLKEEYSDVVNVARMLDLKEDDSIMRKKLQRWRKRIDSHQGGTKQ